MARIPYNTAKVLKLISKTKERDWVRGHRIVINRGTKTSPEYYIGSVTMIKGNKIHIRLDNGDKVSAMKRSPKIMRGKMKQRKKEIPPNKLKLFVEKADLG